jgi:hypothetical protein
MSEDGLHPNDKGYWVIADRLGNLGYEPLYPAKSIAREDRGGRPFQYPGKP